VIGGADGVHRLLKVTVLGVNGTVSWLQGRNGLQPHEQEVIDMTELDVRNRLPFRRGHAMAGVATELCGEPVCGPTVRAAPSQLVEVGQNSADLQNTAVLLLIQERLDIHPHFRGRASLLTIELVEETTVVSGRLPSYYLKQLLQEVIRGVPGVVDIDNQVDVLRLTS
jgi:hypothetical protein